MGFFKVVDFVIVLDSEMAFDVDSMWESSELDSEIILDSVVLDSKFESESPNLESKPLVDSEMNLGSRIFLTSCGFYDVYI